jgi:hypothetical protein
MVELSNSSKEPSYALWAPCIDLVCVNGTIGVLLKELLLGDFKLG